MLVIILQYSEALNKVFVQYSTTCSFRIRATHKPSGEAVLRAMPMFLKQEDSSEPVRRCIVGASMKEPSNLNHPAPEHLLHCQETRCTPTYVQDPDTSFHSVIIAYEQRKMRMILLTFSYICL